MSCFLASFGGTETTHIQPSSRLATRYCKCTINNTIIHTLAYSTLVTVTCVACRCAGRAGGAGQASAAPAPPSGGVDGRIGWTRSRRRTKARERRRTGRARRCGVRTQSGRGAPRLPRVPSAPTDRIGYCIFCAAPPLVTSSRAEGAAQEMLYQIQTTFNSEFIVLPLLALLVRRQPKWSCRKAAIH